MQQPDQLYGATIVYSTTHFRVRVQLYTLYFISLTNPIPKPNRYLNPNPEKCGRRHTMIMQSFFSTRIFHNFLYLHLMLLNFVVCFILQNLTLGFRIYDTCNSETITLARCLELLPSCIECGNNYPICAP